MPRFGKDKSGRNEELDRQAAEEVERLTRRGGPPGMGGGSGSGTPEFMSSPLDMIAAEMAEKPRPSQRRQGAPRKAGSKPQQAFTPMPSGSVGSSFGPGGLNPGPRGMAPAAPPPAFGGGAYDDDHGGPVTGPPVYNAEPDEDEEMTITELALMDQAAHTGHRPEDLVMQFDAGTAEEMRDAAMRQFYERQQVRRPGPSTNSPFAPAGMRRGASGGGGGGRTDDPAVAGGALAQRLANRRRREEEEARRAKAAADPAPAPAASAGVAAKAETADDEGALARVLARRRQALAIDAEPDLDEDARDSGSTLAPGRRHASSRAASSPGLRAVPQPPEIDDADADEEVPTAKKSGRPRKAAAKAPAAKKAAKTTAKAPAAAKAKAVPATKAAPATKKKAARAARAAKAANTKDVPTPKPAKAKAAPARKATKAQKRGATLAKPPAAKTVKAAKARTTGKAKTVFCIECGGKNPAIAKFCFNCGNRLAAPEG